MRQRLARAFSLAGKVDTVESIWNWARRFWTIFWPIVGTSVIGGGLLIWGWMRGNFGPQFVAIVLTCVVLSASSLFVVVGLRRVTNRLGERLQGPKTASNVEEPLKPNQVEVTIIRLLSQAMDLRIAVERAGDGTLSPPLRDSFRVWGYGAKRQLDPFFPGRASFFQSDLPGTSDHVYGADARRYLLDKVEMLKQIRRDIT